MASTKRNILIVVAILVLAAILIFGYLAFDKPAEKVPTAFDTARNTGAEAARILSESFDKSLENLSLIAQYDREGKTELAINLINQEIDQIAYKKERANDLAGAMAQMAQAIPEIEPEEARVAAIEAVSAQVAAVGHLVNYNQKLLDLFDTLAAKFELGEIPPKGTVEGLLADLNAEAKIINQLNTQFADLLKQFDSFFKKQAEQQEAAASGEVTLPAEQPTEATQ